MHIFVMRDHWLAGLACIQSFGRRGHEITLGMREVPSAISRSDFVAHRVPMVPDGPSAGARAHDLIARVEAEGYDIVVPITDDDALAVAIAAEMRPDLAAFVTPSVEAVKLCQDRNATVALCEELGIATPKSAAVTRATVMAAAEQIGFPCFLKLSGTVASEGVFRFETAEALRVHAATMPPDCEAQLQEEVISDFGGMCGFAIAGELRAHVCFATDYDLARVGSPALARAEDNPEMLRILELVAKRLHWTGALDLDVMYRADGTPVMLEINPRMSGSTNLALALGQDIPAGYLEAVGQPVAPVFEAQSFDLYAHLIEEARLRKSAEGRELVANLRAGRRVLDNGYPQDRGYGRAVRQQVRKIGRKGFVERLKLRMGKKEVQA